MEKGKDGLYSLVLTEEEKELLTEIIRNVNLNGSYDQVVLTIKKLEPIVERLTGSE